LIIYNEEGQVRRQKQLRFLMTEPEELGNLYSVVSMLNDESGAEADWDGKNYGQNDAIKLRRLVRALPESAYAIWTLKLAPSDRADLEKFTQKIRVRFEQNGSLSIIDHLSNPYDPASMQFTRLIRNSRRAHLDGPCRKCGRWYVKETLRHREFCSRKCAGGATKANERARKYRAKLQKAERLIRGYTTRANCWKGLNWKEYVVVKEPSISKKFLTIAVNRGELIPPNG
jgi:hypothetical protein